MRDTTGLARHRKEAGGRGRALAFPMPHSCRLCAGLGDEVVKYGARHYVHVPCAVKRWGWAEFLGKLKPYPAYMAGAYAFRVADRQHGSR
jgi:hypothetical protein